MSDDIDRLKKVLEDMRISNDTLDGQGEVMADVFDAVTVLDPTANPEAYGDLVAVLEGFEPEVLRLHEMAAGFAMVVGAICGKLRA